jgi:signal peptidase II
LASADAGWSRAAIVAVFVVVLDQLSKDIVRSSLALGEQRHVIPGLTIVRTSNSGVAFSLLSGSSAAGVTILALVVLAILLAFYARYKAQRLLWVPTGMIAGGAIGNLVDRLREGAVTDFIKLPDWPAFNLADSAITLGVIGLVLVMVRDGNRSSS